MRLQSHPYVSYIGSIDQYRMRYFQFHDDYFEYTLYLLG